MDYYRLTIGSVVYIYDTEVSARSAYHKAVTENGLENVKITKVTEETL